MANILSDSDSECLFDVVCHRMPQIFIIDVRIFLLGPIKRSNRNTIEVVWVC